MRVTSRPANPRVAERRRMVARIATSLGERAERLAIQRDRSGRQRRRRPTEGCVAARLEAELLGDRSKPRVVVSPLPAGVLDLRTNATAWTASWSRVANIAAAELVTSSTVIKTSLMTALASAESCRASHRSASEDAASACIAPARSPSWMAVAKAVGSRSARSDANLATATSASGRSAQLDSCCRGHRAWTDHEDHRRELLMARADGVPALG